MAQREKRKRSKGSAGNNRKISEDFLKKNCQKDTITTTPTGLQYKIIEDTNNHKPNSLY